MYYYRIYSYIYKQGVRKWTQNLFIFRSWQLAHTTFHTLLLLELEAAHNKNNVRVQLLHIDKLVQDPLSKKTSPRYFIHKAGGTVIERR